MKMMLSKILNKILTILFLMYGFNIYPLFAWMAIYFVTPIPHKIWTEHLLWLF